MQISERQRTVLGIAGYTAFFLFSFALFCYLTFPYDRLRDFLVQYVARSAEERPASPAWKLAVDEIGPHWLTGVSLEGVELSRKGKTEKEPPIAIALDEINLSTSLWALLTGTLAVDFDAEVGEGELEGNYSIAGEEGPTTLVAELDEVDVARLGFGGMLGIPVEGKATGEIDLTIAKEPEQTEGEVVLRIEGLKLGDGKAKIPIPGMAAGLTLEQIDAGAFELSLSVKEGIAALDKLEANGKDIELSGSGSLRLVQPLSRARPDITLGFKFEDGYKNKSPRTKAAFDLLENNPQMKRAKAGDGTFRFRLAGNLDNMRLMPAVPTRNRAPRGTPSSGPRKPPRRPTKP